MRNKRRKQLRQRAAPSDSPLTTASPTETTVKQQEQRLDRRPCSAKRKTLRSRAQKGLVNERRGEALNIFHAARIKARAKAIRAQKREAAKQAKLLSSKYVDTEAAVEAPDGSDVKIKKKRIKPQKNFLDGFVVPDHAEGPSVNQRAGYTKSLVLKKGASRHQLKNAIRNNASVDHHHDAMRTFKRILGQSDYGDLQQGILVPPSMRKNRLMV
ncbi:hypothetical protein A4X13_0g5635 [Tilletia indica]|uniref:Ribosome biogenesis protein SLX9 n=1 Tax=Tilletia indica TaxID=43049 RepID=A0A177TBU7_9BASI|nr:hypothetical protein A4X13_0g5635 [Tilletia indica]